MRLPTTIEEAKAIKKKPRYLKHIRAMRCLRCRIRYGIQAHHVRSSQWSGVGMKPPDGLTIPLCHQCHHMIHHNKNKILSEMGVESEVDLLEKVFLMNSVK